jgi:acetylornithine deacetylase/succinyl-diaminopimelate desuccinylase-like protein
MITARTVPDSILMAAETIDGLTSLVLPRRGAVREGGGDDAIDMMRGWGDVEFVATDHGVPTIYYGPGTVAAAHTADEYIELDRYHAGVPVYERAIRAFLDTAQP